MGEPISIRHRLYGWQYAHLADFGIVMAHAKQKLERFLVSQHRGPGERGVALVVWIRISHVRPLDQSLDEEEIVLWMRGRHGERVRGLRAQTHLLRPCEGGRKRPFLPWLEKGRGEG